MPGAEDNANLWRSGAASAKALQVIERVLRIVDLLIHLD
jgi:hypothetical protein